MYVTETKYFCWDGKTCGYMWNTRSPMTCRGGIKGHQCQSSFLVNCDNLQRLIFIIAGIGKESQPKNWHWTCGDVTDATGIDGLRLNLHTHWNGVRSLWFFVTHSVVFSPRQQFISDNILASHVSGFSTVCNRPPGETVVRMYCSLCILCFLLCYFCSRGESDTTQQGWWAFFSDLHI